MISNNHKSPNFLTNFLTSFIQPSFIKFDQPICEFLLQNFSMLRSAWPPVALTFREADFSSDNINAALPGLDFPRPFLKQRNKRNKLCQSWQRHGFQKKERCWFRVVLMFDSVFYATRRVALGSHDVRLFDSSTRDACDSCDAPHVTWLQRQVAGKSTSWLWFRTWYGTCRCKIGIWRYNVLFHKFMLATIKQLK